MSDTTAVTRAEKTTAMPFKEIQVYDDESKKLVKRSPEEQQQSHAMHSMLQNLDMFKGMLLLQMQEEKRYLDFNYSSMKDYVELELQQSYRSVQRYIGIARKITNILPNIRVHGLLPAPGAQPAPEAENTVQEADFEIIEENKALPQLLFSQLKASVWDQLLKFDDEDVAGLFDGGSIEAADGKTYTLEEIKAMSVREAERKLKKQHREERKVLNGKIATLDEDNKKLKAEQATLQKEIERLENRIIRARAIEERYGEKAVSIDEKFDRMNEAIKAFDRFRHLVGNIQFNEDDPDELLLKARYIYSQYEEYRPSLLLAMEDVIFKFELYPDPLNNPQIDAQIAAAMAEQEGRTNNHKPQEDTDEKPSGS